MPERSQRPADASRRPKPVAVDLPETPASAPSDTLAVFHLWMARGDPIAREQLASLLLQRCRRRVATVRPHHDYAEIDESVEVAIQKVLDRPTLFDHSRSDLVTFVTCIAANRVRDHYRHQIRQKWAEAKAATEHLTRQPFVSPSVGQEGEDLCQELRSLLLASASTARERAVVEARLDGVRSWRALADLVECSGLSLIDQKRTVKRIIDRVSKRAVRCRKRVLSELASEKRNRR